MVKFVVFAFISVTLAACASTSVTPVAKNQVIISTRAAPVCGGSGAAKVASKMAAVETIRRGYQRYMILGAQSENNVRVLRTGPTYATTNTNVSVFGNQAVGNSTTYYGGQQTIVTGGHNSGLAVMMFNPGEPGFNNALDARTELGLEWQELVADGIKTCAS